MNGSGERVASAEIEVPREQEDRQAEQQHEIVEHRDDAGGEEIVQRVHVGRRARDEPPDRGAVEEAHRQALQMLENFLAQVVHRLLADPLHDPHLDVLHSEARRAARP